MADAAWIAELRGVRSIHFVGIGGAGMCGIAEVLLRQGYAVSGSDLVRSATTKRLAALGARVRQGHAAAAVADADAVVVSSAIGDANVEVARARALGIPVVARGEMLGELMRHRYGIAVAGSHGKTTTASLIADILQAAGLDPSFVIGGTVASEGANARLGGGRHLVAEADESDASFLYLRPMIAVVTGIDRDHLDTYDQDLGRLTEAFIDFACRLPFYGTVVACLDDPRAAGLVGKLGRRTLTYGFASGADFRATDVRIGEGSWTCTVSRPEAGELRIAIPLPGSHNVQNALASVAVATEEGVADDAIVAGLAEFRGVARRFGLAECVVAGKRVTLVDDYGHHPTEVARIIATVRRMWPERRLVMAYQPHRYTRTRDLLDDFSTVLSRVDALLIADVYGAGERPIAGADGHVLAQRIGERGRLDPLFVATPEQAVEQLQRVVEDGDVVMVQGAGDIDRVAAAMVSTTGSAGGSA